MIDDEHIPIEQLVMKRIGRILEKIVPQGIIVHEISSEGPTRYRFILSTEDRKCRHGVTFPTAPSNRQVHGGVAVCVGVIARMKPKGART
jgi:hypothetical protein